MSFEPKNTYRAGVALAQPGEHGLTVKDIAKSYAATRAVDSVDLTLTAENVTAVVGGNGAGKSTLMKILAGEAHPDTGSMSLDGSDIEFSQFSPARAHELGIRIVHQELSLCGSLTVAENFYIEQAIGRTRFGWRKKFARIAEDALERAFGKDHRIATASKIEQLNAGERQMVEIARAASSPGLRVLILDEPTSALGSETVRALDSFIRELQKRGVIVIFISHKMDELQRMTDRVVVMREGKVAADKPTQDTTVDEILGLMLGDATASRSEDTSLPGSNARKIEDAPVLLKADVSRAHEVDPLTLRSGEIVGLVGLQGAGQESILRAIQANKKHISLNADVTYITGDRKHEGIFHLWSAERNLSIAVLANKALRIFRWNQIRKLAEYWFERLALPTVAAKKPITALSGGMQQKVLFSRGLSTGAKIILLNDPTRGVDLKTKRDMYHLIRLAAQEGAGILWYSSEDTEVDMFDRAYAMNDGYVVSEFIGDRVDSASMMTSALQAQTPTKHGDVPHSRLRTMSKGTLSVINQRWIFAFIGLAVVIGVLQSQTGILQNPVGLGLVLTIAPVLALSSVTQMFMVAVGDLDLGVGAFMSLVVTIAATTLATNPIVGIALLVLVTMAYPALALLLSARPFPALVATLAMSFVYTGLALTILPNVGGTVPSWLVTATQLSAGQLPYPVVVIVVIAVVSWIFISRSALGTRIRALGANPVALVAAGRSVALTRVAAYSLGGVAATLGGLYFAGVATSGDAHATDSYTLMTIACVVVGGCTFLGGNVSPVGVALSAVLLSLIGVLLGILQVPSLFTAAATGVLLILVMALRRIFRREAAD